MTLATVIDAAFMAEIGDAICHQLHALADRPDPETAANIAVNLDGARRAVLRLRESLMQQEVRHGGTG